jgi:hypothetical protein
LERATGTEQRAIGLIWSGTRSGHERRGLSPGPFYQGVSVPVSSPDKPRAPRNGSRVLLYRLVPRGECLPPASRFSGANADASFLVVRSVMRDFAAVTPWAILRGLAMDHDGSGTCWE